MSYQFLLQEDQPYQYDGQTFKFFAGVENKPLKTATATFIFPDKTIVLKYTFLTKKYYKSHPNDPFTNTISFNLSNSCWFWNRT